MPQVKVLLFGKAAELAGLREKFIVIPSPSSYEDLLRVILDTIPSLNPIKSTCVIAIDQKYKEKDDEITINSNTEIAIIPPLSGG